MAMTEREFLTKVLAIEELPEEMKTYAEEKIEKLDARNDHRKNTQTKTQKENESVMNAILEYLTANGSDVASSIGSALSISTQKASALCKLLTDSGKLTVADVKVKGKGTLKQYTIVESETETEEENGEG